MTRVVPRRPPAEFRRPKSTSGSDGDIIITTITITIITIIIAANKIRWWCKGARYAGAFSVC
jgi:hypothetical protein